MNNTGEKRITILYFAGFREKIGVSQETITTRCRTSGDLYREIAEIHDLPYIPETVRVAVNAELRDWQSQVRDGDTVVFLAPFGGG